MTGSRRILRLLRYAQVVSRRLRSVGYLMGSVSEFEHGPNTTGSHMRRSRSPPSRNTSIICCICTDEVTRDAPDLWQCAGCRCRCHESCIQCAATFSPRSQIRCPVCRASRSDIVRALTAPRRATNGCICYTCRCDIAAGELMIQCANFTSQCVALFHDRDLCRPRIRCPACDQSMQDIIADRRTPQ